MRFPALFSLLLAACASAPMGSADGQRAVYEGYTVDEVRRAAVATLNDLGRFMSPARVTEDGRVVSEYGASGWTSYEVRLDERDGAAAAEISIERRPQWGCSPRRLPHPVSAAKVHAARAPVERGTEPYRPISPLLPREAYDAECSFRVRVQDVRSRRERSILEEIRDRLEADRRPDGSIVAEI